MAADSFPSLLKKGFPIEQRHNDVTGGRDLP